VKGDAVPVDVPECEGEAAPIGELERQPHLQNLGERRGCTC
jgi:hypothetical protein